MLRSHQKKFANMSITESDFQHEIVRFLRGSLDRNGGRRARQNAKAMKQLKKGEGR
jgi:hypothetical protein